MTLSAGNIERRALILAPAGRDAAVAVALLQEAGLHAASCQNVAFLADAIQEGCGLVIVTEEALRSADPRPLVAAIEAQPPWSDIPFLLLAAQNSSDRVLTATRFTGLLGNVTFLERPFHPTTLLSVVHTALRSRDRQYQARAHLQERTVREAALRKSETALLQHRSELEQLVSARTAALERAMEQLRQESADRARAENALRQSQKMEAVGQLTGGIAHDFNNLLSAIMGGLELILRKTNDESIRRLASAAVDATRRGAKLTGQLLAFSRTQQLTLAPIELNGLVDGLQDLLVRSIGPLVELRCRPAREPVWVRGDCNQLELALLNLSINARDAMPNGGRLTVSVDVGDLNGRRMARVSVADTGAGMPPDVVERAFEPFFTTKAVGKGTGLGLAQVYGIAQQSGGAATIESEVGRGSVVCITLPLSERETPRWEPTGSGQATTSIPQAQGTVTVLVVDDDPAVRGSLVEMLRSIGYRVIEAHHGRAGLELLSRTPGLDVMIVDYIMPGMTGAEVALAARRQRPTLPILFSTGFADTSALGGALASVPILRKPFRLAELASSVASEVSKERRARASGE